MFFAVFSNYKSKVDSKVGFCDEKKETPQAD